MTDLDQLDQRILRELCQEGRITNTALAERVGLSASACLRRVQELERIGIIAGYRAILDPRALGNGFIAYIAVGLSAHNKATQKAFESAMALSPEVRECHNITGIYEYLLRVEVGDIQTYKRFHTDTLGALPSVTTLSSFVVLESSKDARG
ncbi:MAG: Lrp/AsnC family transcriptional regulator [Caulobacteraceae bacterium]|nr:Lrp/AsnC family transcriptional regulator [Caulobacteraceae bacterium]